MTGDASGGRVGFEVDGETLRVRDAIEGTELRLVLDREPEPQPALTDLFPFPVDRAISFEAGSISVPEYSSVSVRTADGEFVARLDEPMELPRGSYCVDVSGATKVLIRAPDVAAETTGMADSGPVDVGFDRPITVTVGARSLHARPEATITVPDDPVALAEAVSVLGSSIKEFSPERSWPTLRGYPPRIERGDELDVPSPLVAPDTGVEVVVRPEYADVYRLSTLSYYLGARMVVGDAPAIRLDTGYVESLPTEGVALEERAEELLRTWFFLDTLARTEGYVPSDRYEYEQVGPELPFYPPKLADRSMSDRLMEYLEVCPETVAPYAPDWPTEAVLRPGPAGAELLPHLVHVLAPVRVRGAAEPPDPDAPTALATSPWLAPSGGVPDPDDDPLPAGTSVLTTASYENRLRRTIAARGEVRVVALAGSRERGAALRRVLSDPAVPEGVGEWEVLDRPDAETAAAVLSDPDVDIAYCGLPVESGEVTASDGPVALAALDDAPALTIFEDTDAVDDGVVAVENGGLGAVVSEDPLTPDRLRKTVGLLAAGVPFAASVRLSTGAPHDRGRIVGDPAGVIASNQGLPVSDISIESFDGNTYQTVRSSILTVLARLGTDYIVIRDYFSDLTELAGLSERERASLTTAELLEWRTEPDGLVRVGDEAVLPSEELTETELEVRVRRLLRDGSDDHPRPEQYWTE
ncbi:hypothetical protein U4E84_14615 [Halorubrum sp. AD140]|uniref:hypothetical protein n=1 Tax=Halorubrum sp. AD140 TaxID=3050073 RepID=UPI002ACC8EE8|nr:hypothetical protein [Halorubrum sp. AD140]MDZ5812578.1 hypothetical protein [Halorubrum sp. AD140]